MEWNGMAPSVHPYNTLVSIYAKYLFKVHNAYFIPCVTLSIRFWYPRILFTYSNPTGEICIIICVRVLNYWESSRSACPSSEKTKVSGT